MESSQLARHGVLAHLVLRVHEVEYLIRSSQRLLKIVVEAGKLAHRLLQLPGVLGVRVKIAKLEIFEDCEVAIRMEAGQW